MLCSTKGIVLQNVKYADKKIISRIYTNEFGIISVNAIVSKSSKSKISNSLIQPLTLVEIELLFKENHDVHALKEIRLVHQYHSLHDDFHKLCVAQFMNEVLVKCLKEQAPNADLFEFIIQVFVWLDDTDQSINQLPVYFLFHLTRFLGFFPLESFEREQLYFNLIDGQFQSHRTEFPLGLNADQTQLFKLLFELDLSGKKSLSKQQRDLLMEILLLYYKYHLPGFSELKSYRVLQDTLHH